MSIALVVFDLAGTTVEDNNDVPRVLQNALQKNGITVSISDANGVMGVPKPVAIKKLLTQHYAGKRSIDESFITEIHTEFVDEMIHFYATDLDVRELPGVSDLFKKLKERKLQLFVDTGFDRQITDTLLARLGWLLNGLIDGSITSDEVMRGRPYPDMIFKAMELAGVTDAKQVMKVGDTAFDLQEGTAAGCGWVIGVTSGAFTREALAQEAHTHLVETAEEVWNIVREIS